MDGAAAAAELASERRRAVVALLARAGDASGASLEADLLLAHALGCSRAQLLLRTVLEAHEVAAFRALLVQRVEHARPVAYLTGRRAFRELELYVDERVLVPRPETELLVDVFLELEARGEVPPGPVADRGTGSGCLALSVAGRRKVIAVDLSAGALAVAARNVDLCGAAGRVALLQSDGLAALAHGSLAAVLANPPYVSASEHARLPEDVRRHEPRLALVPPDGDVAGMYARLLPEALRALAPGGWLCTEVGAGQAGWVAQLASGSGCDRVEVRRDLAGIERVVALRKRPGARPRGAQP